MFPNRNQGQSPQQPINLYRPGTEPQNTQVPPAQPAQPLANPSGLPVHFMNKKKAEGNKTIIIFVLAVLVAIFAGLFVWKFLDWSSVSSTIDYKVEQGIADRERQIGDELEAEWTAKLNSETETFLGPSNYGSLTFNYPKVWSVYVEKDDSVNNGEFTAYLNPSSVGPVTTDSVFALRVKILSTTSTTTFASITDPYNNEVKAGTMTSYVVTIDEGTSSATVYAKNDGTSKTAIFQIPNRNQVAIIKTDSVKNFGTYFQNALDSIKVD